MRWLAAVALGLAAIALGLQVARPTPPSAASPSARYQVVHAPGGHVVRLDVHTGEMAAFFIAPPELVSDLKQRYGDFNFIEFARSVEGTRR